MADSAASLIFLRLDSDLGLGAPPLLPVPSFCLPCLCFLAPSRSFRCNICSVRLQESLWPPDKDTSGSLKCPGWQSSLLLGGRVVLSSQLLLHLLSCGQGLAARHPEPLLKFLSAPTAAL